MPRNVIPAPLLCVLTSISMEHMAFLGDTLEKIASIRRGSLKQGSVVTVKQRPEAMKVIEDACKSKEAPSFCPGSDKISAKSTAWEKQRFSYGNHKGLEITMAGIYQR